MKVLQNLAVLTAVIFIGACSVSPEESAFLDAVKGKTVVASDGTTDLFKFSNDGRSVDSVPATGKPFSFKSAESELKATYELSDGGATAKIVLTLNADKKGGSVSGDAGEMSGLTLK
ncbi:MAG: hypothetical protein ACRCY4_03605 [Brevinema sp.]